MKSEHTRHIVRLVGLLLLAAVTGALARSALKPDTFGDQGHFRAAVLDEIAALPQMHIGTEACAESCHDHDDKVSAHDGGAHAVVPCENCHGAARGHAVDSPGRLSLKVTPSQETCLICHAKIAGRPESQPQIEVKAHAEDQGFEPDAGCTDCHNPHDPTP